jgi:uncharacterized protein (DUF305 family)
VPLYTRIKNLATAGVAFMALAATLAACGGDPTDAAADPSAMQTAENGDVFNGADVQFASDMIPHHAQAIEMVALTEGRTLDPEVAAIAEEIRGAQEPELETMTTWLSDWGQDVPDPSSDMDMGEMDMGDDMSSMPGMMSADEMTGLAEASDAEFRDMWIEMMIEHHTGAIEMARAEQDNGEFPDAIALAEEIESAQEAEIEELKALLAS